MVNKDFFLALDALEQEKGISKEYFREALQTALTSAYKRNSEKSKPVEVVFKPERSQIEIYAYQTIVAEVTDPNSEIALADAKLIKKTARIGDKIKEDIYPKEFQRIAASIAKQVIKQKLREQEKNSAYGEFNSKVDTLITGIVKRIDAGYYFP